MSERVTSCVCEHGGVPTLFVNGTPCEGAAYMTYITENSRYDDFAGVGYRLFSMPAFFATRSINVQALNPPFEAGIFESGTADFTVFDKNVERILAVCPDAYIFPRVNVTLPKWWDDANPDALCDSGAHDIRMPCFASDKWAEKVKEFLGVLIDHVESMPWRDNFVGYQLSCGQTEEWFAYDINGSVGKRSREKFDAWCKEKKLVGTDEEYFRFISRVTAMRLCELAHFVKEKTERRLVVGGFYGYVMYMVWREMCHHALEDVLASPDIDFLCSPVSYAHLRESGRDHPNMTAIDSIKLHGKLYFAENDTRTDLSRACCDLPHYNTPIWFGPEREKSLEILKLHFARALTHGHALWWFDMWGGWYAADEYMEFMRRARDIAVEAMNKPLSGCARAAVFVDERAHSKLKGATITKVIVEPLEALGKTAVPYDVYLMSDYDAVKSRYNAIVILRPTDSELISQAIDEAKTAGRHYIVIDENNCGITAAELREFFIGAGITPRCDREAVVYENESYIFLHTVSDEAVTLDCGCTLRDVFGGDVTFPLKVGKGKSFLFEKLR